MVYANAGIPVIMKETTQEALDRGWSTIQKNYANSVKRGRFTQEYADQRLQLITPQLTWDGFDQADIMTNCRVYPKDEAPAAYKDFDEVLRSVKSAGLATEVARLKARFVIKDGDAADD